MIALRPYSHVGWFMLQWLGVLVPTAFRDEVRRAAQAQGKSVHQRIPKVDLHALELTCPMCGGPASKAQLDDPHGCCEDCYWRLPDGSVGDRQDRPEVYEELTRRWPAPRAVVTPATVVAETVDLARELGVPHQLWWLSFANDMCCAGIALVWLDGEQTLERAAQAAVDQGLTPPGGPWEVFGCEVPEQERAPHLPHAGRLLTTAEAADLFGAKSLGAWEGEYPEAVAAICGDDQETP